ncbi:hypothetical protein BS47DRAFT_721362 [Hydnum rufescens UP504]|uniref:Uncharacterized protein n=1 Tax=Hydnum rufescens UP504 TaxID=1448309 RepID=A0A9P6B184_9AGAM|nr:hypothetical protein BS47DRAFT_721362 [Hydnum rufescens UP504]
MPRKESRHRRCSFEERAHRSSASHRGCRTRERTGTEVSLLLLGQSESGKSTLQKQFQLLYAPSTFNEERPAWRAIIFINIISAVRDILRVLEDVAKKSPHFAGPSQRSDPLHLARLRLGPLLSMESKLVQAVDAGYHTDNDGSREIFVHQGWQRKHLATPRTETPGGARSLDETHRESLEDETLSETSHLLDVCKDYIRELSGHPDVIRLTESGKIMLKESSSLSVCMFFICLPCLELNNFLMARSSFLSDLDRLALPQWVPTDSDILYARVRTVGVATHHYSISVRNKTRSWRLFDVGGTRGQRKAWLPFFEGTTAVIFLAPVSVFDEFLDEAPETNRMDDCMQLFSDISSSPLLKKTHIVLFLNKSDILRRKLLHGIRITDFINTFAPRENEISVALQFFRDHFSEIFFRTNKVNDRRQLFVHATTIVDIPLMRKLIDRVVTAIFFEHFRSATLI